LSIYIFFFLPPSSVPGRHAPRACARDGMAGAVLAHTLSRVGTLAPTSNAPLDEIGLLCPRAHLWNPRGGPQDYSHIAAMAQAPWVAVGQILPCVECAASYKNHPCPNRSYPLRRRRPGDSFPQILCHQPIETEKEKKGGEEIEGGGDPGAEGAAARNAVDGREEGHDQGGRSRPTVRLRAARHRNAVTSSRHWRPWNAERC
jgi:hypothetical protein